VTCPFDRCHIIGMWSPFLALWASSRSAASASYKDVDDASPWWRRLCDVTANRSPNCYIPLLNI